LQRRTRLNDGTEIGYARGLAHEQVWGEAVISHAGASAGYRAWLGRWPGRRLSVALLCNAGNVDVVPVARQVARLWAADLPAPPMRPTSDGAPYAGLWVNERTGMPLRLEVRGYALAVVGGPELDSVGPASFRGSAGVYVFRGADQLTLETNEGERVRFARAQAWTPAAADLAASAGTYRSEEAAARYEVRAEGGGLVIRNIARPHLVQPLRPVYRDAFEVEGGIVRFVRAPRGGRVATMSLGLPRVRSMIFTPERRR
jgi:hypothetical protein